LTYLSLSSNKLNSVSHLPKIDTLLYLGLFGNEFSDS